MLSKYFCTAAASALLALNANAIEIKMAEQDQLPAYAQV